MKPGLLWCPWQAQGAITSTLGSNISLPWPQKSCKIFSASLQEPGSCFKPGARSQWHTAIVSPQICILKSLLQPPGGGKLSQNTLSHSLQDPCTQDQTTLLVKVCEGGARAVLIKSTLKGAVGHCGAPAPRMGRAGGETTAGRKQRRAGKAWCWCCALSYASEMWYAEVRNISCSKSSMRKKRLLHHKEGQKWWLGQGNIPDSERTLQGSGRFWSSQLWGCSLHRGQKMICGMPSKGSLLQAACLTQFWEGHMGLAGRETIWIPAQTFVSLSLSQMATYYLAANPTQSFQSLTLYYEAHSDC